MKSPKYLAVVPSALDSFELQLTSDGSQCWNQCIGVFSDLFLNAEQCLFSSCCSSLVDRELGNIVHEGEESRVD